MFSYMYGRFICTKPYLVSEVERIQTLMYFWKFVFISSNPKDVGVVLLFCSNNFYTNDGHIQLPRKTYISYALDTSQTYYVQVNTKN